MDLCLSKIIDNNTGNIDYFESLTSYQAIDHNQIIEALLFEYKSCTLCFDETIPSL